MNDDCKREPLALEEIPYSALAGITADPNHFMLNNFAQTSNRLLQAGIIQNWYENFTTEYIRVLKIESKGVRRDKEPQVLTLEGLSFGFVLYLGACGISFVVFIIEVMSNCLKKKKIDRKMIKKVKSVKIHPENVTVKTENIKINQTCKGSGNKLEETDNKTDEKSLEVQSPSTTEITSEIKSELVRIQTPCKDEIIVEDLEN